MSPINRTCARPFDIPIGRVCVERFVTFAHTRRSDTDRDKYPGIRVILVESRALLRIRAAVSSAGSPVGARGRRLYRNFTVRSQSPPPQYIVKPKVVLCSCQQIVNTSLSPSKTHSTVLSLAVAVETSLTYQKNRTKPQRILCSSRRTMHRARQRSSTSSTSDSAAVTGCGGTKI